MGQERPVTARDLDQIVVRVLRGGKWLNGFVGELDYLTEEEIASTIPSLGNVIRALLNDNPAWEHSVNRQVWIRRD
jgi:hypothetical protein